MHAPAENSMRAVEGARPLPPLLGRLPDEICLHVLFFLDVDDLLSASRTSRHLRMLSLDPLLHKWRLEFCHRRVGYLLPRRPALHTLQPPVKTIYLTRTHLAARRLHWSLVCIRLNRSLLRRPKLSTLVSANILPKDCCRRDRVSGEFVWNFAGTILQRKRKVEVEKIKEGLRVWLERKARQIQAKRREGGVGVGVLIWKLSHRTKSTTDGLGQQQIDTAPGVDVPEQDRVSSLRRFFEGLGNGSIS